MKKRFILFAVIGLLVAQYGFSQVFVGGSLNYSNTMPAEGEGTYTLNLQPMIGYRMELMDIGATVGFAWNDATKVRTFALAPFADYYLFGLDQLSILGRATLRYSNTENTSTTNAPASHEIRLSVSPVAEYRLMDNLALYASIGELYINHAWADNVDGSTNINLSIDNIINFGSNIGFIVFF